MTTLDDLARVERELRCMADALGYSAGDWIRGNAGTIAEYIAAQREREANMLALAEAVNQRIAKREWQPIETAPRDGSWFLVWNGHWVGVAKYREPYDDTDPCPSWEDESGHFITPQPTIWQPLPEPPKENTNE